MQLSSQDIREADQKLEAMTAPKRIRWAVDMFGDKLILSTSKPGDPDNFCRYRLSLPGNLSFRAATHPTAQP